MGNSLGSFVDMDLSFLQTGVMCMGKVLVNIDLRKGLEEDILIEWGDRVFLQPLNYLVSRFTAIDVTVMPMLFCSVTCFLKEK